MDMKVWILTPYIAALFGAAVYRFSLLDAMNYIQCDTAWN